MDGVSIVGLCKFLERTIKIDKIIGLEICSKLLDEAHIGL